MTPDPRLTVLISGSVTVAPSAHALLLWALGPVLVKEIGSRGLGHL